MSTAADATDDSKSNERGAKPELAVPELELPEGSAVGTIMATRPLSCLTAIGCAMLCIAAAGQIWAPLQFDGSISGFTPRGTPVATRVNTGLLIQKALEDKTIQGYPHADCDTPPVEMWLAVCGGDTSSALKGATASLGLTPKLIGNTVASLSTSCNPICMRAVAPWARECRAHASASGAGGGHTLAEAVGAAILKKLPVRLANSRSCPAHMCRHS